MLTALPHDVQVTLQILTGVVILTLQSVNLWRSIVNGRGIKNTRSELTGLSAVTADIQKQMHVARQALAKIDALMATAKPYSSGRRATDNASDAVVPPRPPGITEDRRSRGGPTRENAVITPPRDAGPPRPGFPMHDF